MLLAAFHWIQEVFISTLPHDSSRPFVSICQYRYINVSYNVYSAVCIVMFACVVLYAKMSLYRVCTQEWMCVSMYVRNSSNVGVMSQASRGGSLPHLINDTPRLMIAPSGKQRPRTLPLSSPSIYLSIHPSSHMNWFPLRLQKTCLYLIHLCFCGKPIESQCQAEPSKGSFLFLSR